MVEPDYEQLYKTILKDQAQQRTENSRLTKLLEELQKNLQTSLEGNTELRQQMKDLQEKLDRLLAQRKNRNRKEFDTKNEGHNPRPAQKETKSNRLRQDDDDDIESGGGTTDESSLPVEIVEHHVSDEARICPDCHVDTVLVGNTITNQLEALVHTLKRLEHRQEVRSCPKCRTYMTTATKPTAPIPGGRVGPGLLAKIIVGKVDDGLPNNRQQKMFAREDASVPRSTQCDWFIAASLTVEPLWELINREILASSIIQTDESGIKVQDRKLVKNIRKAKMTVYRGDHTRRFVSFRYSPDLSFELNKQFLKDFSGIVQADAAGGFDALFNDGTKIEAGCHAHARRRVYDARDVEPKHSKRMLNIYTKLYKIEKKARRLSPEVRLAMRRRFSKPLIKKLRIMHVQNKKDLSPSNLLFDAASYALNHWRALTQFLKNPMIEIDNNASERQIKPFVLARKNFLMCGSDAGARALAIHLSLIASAKRNGLNPVEYLTDVFTRINDMKTSQLHQLLPDRWASFKNQGAVSTDQKCVLP